MDPSLAAGRPSGRGFRIRATGKAVGEVLSVTLKPGEWYQWNRVVEQANAPTTQVTAWITKREGDDTFFAYGVVNDAVTSDGSFIRMIRLEAE
ncbi:MAG: hypothetical protein L6R30_24880 [Thermoanaerobaculia bacterium]|nr:hypothetical protein [Thermoanaerobaculia bacterium]